MAAFLKFAHIPFDFVFERSIGRSRKSRRVSRLHPVRLTDGALGGGSRALSLLIKETTHVQH